MLGVFGRKVQDQGIRPGKIDILSYDLLSSSSSSSTPAALQPASFDLIFSQLAFHHIPDGRAMIHRLMELLAPGGTLCVIDFEATPNAYRFHPTHMKLGADYEYDGISEEQAKSWFRGTEASLTPPTLYRTPFKKEAGEGHAVTGAAGPDKREDFVMMLIMAQKRKGKEEPRPSSRL
eukprot:g927.t1